MTRPFNKLRAPCLSRKTLKFGGCSVKLTSRSSTAAPTPSRPRRRKLWIISCHTACGVCRCESASSASMSGMGLLHRGHLLGTCDVLMFRLPGLIGHAVDGLATLVPGQRNALLIGGILQPVRQAVAAEACQVHQVDVLDVSALAQV